MDDIQVSRSLEDVVTVLHENGVPIGAAGAAWVGAAYSEALGGLPLAAFWATEAWDVRDDFMLLSALSVDVTLTATKLSPPSERLDTLCVAAMLQLKMNAQAVVSLDTLVNRQCYADAYSVLRATISRLHLFILFTLQPSLYDRWLKNPNEEMFLDGHVRRTLNGEGISIPTHLYDMASEIIHGHIEALGEIGLFEKGIFPASVAVRHNVFTAAKFVFGAWWHAVLSVVLLDFRNKQLPEVLASHEEAHALFVGERLAPNSAINLFTFMAQERHWEKVGKNKWLIGGSYDPAAYRAKLAKFHPLSGQRARLPKKYDKIPTDDR